MVFYCCVPECKSSGYTNNVSMHGFPKEQKLQKIWKERIRRSTSSSTKDDFVVTSSTKVCSVHFLKTDFTDYEADRRRLAASAIPSIFSWTTSSKRKSPKKRYHHDSDETDSASEGEYKVHAETQVELYTCSHSVSTKTILHSHPKLNLIKFYTGFSNYTTFSSVLELLVPGKDRSNIVYWDRRKTNSYTCGAEYFDSDDDSDSEDTDGEEYSRDSMPYRTHNLSVEDEFLLTLMKLKLGLFNKDLAFRFKISLSTVTKIFKTWINLIFLKLGSMKIFPHRDVISKNMTNEFKRQYSKVMLIIDCTELKIEMPSSLVRKSQTYSDYKSTNTFKGLLGVDCRGGIMFVSHLYTGSISDKKICQRSGLFDLMKMKIENGELIEGDAIMADKGFTVAGELQELGLKLNIPPFLGKRKKLQAADVQETQVIAHHRIHVERAIGKVRNFHIFDRKLRIKSAGLINQIWTDCCLLSNFQDPIISTGLLDADVE